LKFTFAITTTIFLSLGSLPVLLCLPLGCVFFLVKEVCESGLPPGVLLHLSRYRSDSVTREADAGHRVEDRLVGDAVANEEDLAVEARLQAVDLLPFSQSRNHHRCADVDQE
jgi:hypothetical protein